MKKSGILMVAMMAAAGLASAQDMDFDGGKGLAGGSPVAVAAEASKPDLIPMIEPWNMGQEMPLSSNDAPFMNEEACAILDAGFFVQPSREEAVEMLKPCLAALSGRYKTPLKAAPGKDDLHLFVGDAKNSGRELRDALRVNLKAKSGWKFFGHDVTLFAAGASVNKGWWDDAETVYNAVTEDPVSTAALALNAIKNEIAEACDNGVGDHIPAIACRG